MCAPRDTLMCRYLHLPSWPGGGGVASGKKTWQQQQQFSEKKLRGGERGSGLVRVKERERKELILKKT